MDFDFSDDQNSLRDAVRRWVDKAYSFDRRQRIVAEGGFSRDAWREMAELGLTGLTVPDDAGGMGFGAVEAMVVMEELGRGLVLEPLAHAALVAPAILSQGEAGRPWLERIVAGDALVVLALQERAARYRLPQVITTATRSGEGWAVSGSKSVVPVGDLADAFIVPARVGGAADDPQGVALFLVERMAEGVSTRGYALQDGSRAAEVTFKHAAARPLVDVGTAYEVLEQAVDTGIASVCAEAVGAMERLFDLTREYMNTRKQFGVPIASFQALRHRVADMKMQLELGRSMSYLATLRLGDEATVRRRAVSQAKVQLGQSMRFVGQQAIQLHGGIAMTNEYSAGHYFKRLTCIELSFGDTMHHLGEVNSRMQDTAGVFA